MKKNSLRSFCLALVFAGGLLHSSALAQSISFNFGGATGDRPLVPADLAGAPGSRVGNWNNVAGLNATGNVATYPNGAFVDSTGAVVTGLTSTITSGNTNFGGDGANNGGNTTNDAQLFAGHADQYDGTATTISITNIPFALYNVAFYMHNDGAARGGSFTLGSTTYYMRGGLADPNTAGIGYVQSTDTTFGLGTDIDQGNYVLFTGLTGDLAASFTAVNAGDGTQRSKVTGFQIISVPEPGTYGMMFGGLGLLMMIQHFRRRSC